MSAEILLDPKGDITPPIGYRLVDTEVDFLRVATEDIPLVIRGTPLCRWAELYFSIHNRPTCIVESTTSVLGRNYIELTETQAQSLATRLPVSSLSDKDGEPKTLLKMLYPLNAALWQQSPSREHSALWLLWMIENHPDEAIQVILRAHVQTLSASISSEWLPVYKVHDANQARLVLFAWLGLSIISGWHPVSEFPLDFPLRIEKDIIEAIRKRIVVSKGGEIEELLSTNTPINIKCIIATQALDFYQNNQKLLSPGQVDLLMPYLSQKQISILEKILPPRNPDPMPVEVPSVQNWFINQYLPYRRWQQESDEVEARSRVLELAKGFALWYLSNYLRWLIKNENVSFFYTSSVQKGNQDHLLLIVILDGLPVWDSLDLIKSIDRHIERLTLVNEQYAFAPIPTITEFAKEAMLRGVPPQMVKEKQDLLGEIIPDNVYANQIMAKALQGSVYFWRLAEPDRTYHSKNKAKLSSQIKAQLDAFVEELIKVVEAVPVEHRLRIIITSDHGRLLNGHSKRELVQPDNFQAHGRVAWGKLERTLPAEGYEVDESQQVVYIRGKVVRALDEGDLIIPLGESSFLTNDGKRGEEAYPHGGLFPEEVIVPWLDYERDIAPPLVEVTMRGAGEAGKKGDVNVSITNLSRLYLEVLSIELLNQVKPNLGWLLSPLAPISRPIELSPYPSESESKSLVAEITLRQPNGRTFIVKTYDIILKIEEMYKREEDILKDLM